MSTWRKILAWEVQSEVLRAGDFVRFSYPSQAASVGVDVPWCEGEFEIIRSDEDNRHPYFPGEIAMVPRQWHGGPGELPPVYTLAPSDHHMLELVGHVNNSSLRWDVQTFDFPEPGMVVKFLRTARLEAINLSWADVQDQTFTVVNISVGDDDWEDAGLGTGVVLVESERSIYSVPLEHWTDYIKVVG